MTPPFPSARPSAPADPVGLALRGVAAGVLTGGGLIAIALWGVRTLQLSESASPDLAHGPGLLLLAGTLGGVLAAAATAWTLLAPIDSLYRRGALAIVSAFATMVVSLAAIPLDRGLGRYGLLLFAAGCSMGCLWLVRRAFR